nr:uncharacterized protein LOC124808972 isoform X2 [Hydra vulgaris]
MKRQPMCICQQCCCIQMDGQQKIKMNIIILFFDLVWLSIITEEKSIAKKTNIEKMVKHLSQSVQNNIKYLENANESHEKNHSSNSKGILLRDEKSSYFERLHYEIINTAIGVNNYYHENQKEHFDAKSQKPTGDLVIKNK